MESNIFEIMDCGGCRSVVVTSSEASIPLPAHVELRMPIQTHTTNVDTAVRNRVEYPETDALISTDEKIAVGVRTADCVPIVAYCPDIRAVAAVHAGWKGTIGGIIGKTIDKLVASGADKEKMMVAFGPSICGDCYEVGDDLGKAFVEGGYEKCVFINNVTGKYHVNLQEVNREIITLRGIPTENIRLSGFCSRHTELCGNHPFPSYRRDKGTEERMRTIIYLKAPSHKN